MWLFVCTCMCRCVFVPLVNQIHIHDFSWGHQRKLGKKIKRYKHSSASCMMNTFFEVTYFTLVAWISFRSSYLKIKNLQYKGFVCTWLGSYTYTYTQTLSCAPDVCRERKWKYMCHGSLAVLCFVFTVSFSQSCFS